MDINQFLATESGRLTYDFYIREQYSSPWISLPKKVAWPDGMGQTIDNIMWERPYIEGSEADWGAMTMNPGIGLAAAVDGGSCIPPVDEVRFSHTLRRTSLYHKALNGPQFCVTDLLYAGKRETQMRAIEWGMSDMVRLYWINWNKTGFRKLAKKVILEPSLTTYDETYGDVFPDVEPTSRMTNGVLDYYHNLLTLEQGGRHRLSTQNGRAVYGFISDSLTLRSLTKGDSSVREDFRYANPDKLLEPLGCSHTYNGYIHMVDEMPDRYTFNSALAADSGVSSVWNNAGYTDPWTKVEPYDVTPDADGIVRKKVNPEWLTAPYQDSYIYVKEAYQLRVPGSVAGISKAQFEPQMYMGEVKFQNVIDLDPDSPTHNPDGKIGRFRCTMGAGVEPINPHVMYVIRHKVCQELALEDCP